MRVLLHFSPAAQAAHPKLPRVTKRVLGNSQV